MRPLTVIALILAVCVAGCGYTSKSLLPTEFKSIYVANFANRINVTAESTDTRMYRGYRPGMEIEITKAVEDRFLFDGNLKVAKEASADLVLKGELIDYNKEVLKYDTNDNAEEYRVRVAVRLELKDAKTGKTVWTENNFAGESTYRTGGSLAENETTAVGAAIADLARRVVERTVEAW
jgi:outer membrane lipopolysaccharide assembly protein LptE/RlpB